MKKIFMLIVPIAILVIMISCKSPSQEESQSSLDDLPAYTIIDQVNLITGGKYGDILITSFSKTTPRATRESILRRIAKKEGFTEASLYCTMDAYKANNSASYLKAHPNALKEGCLGYLKDGKFFELY